MRASVNLQLNVCSLKGQLKQVVNSYQAIIAFLKAVVE